VRRRLRRGRAPGLALRQPGFVTRQVLFNTIPPFLHDAYTAAGIEPIDFTAHEHFVRHGTRADELLQTLDTPQHRRVYVAGFYGAHDAASGNDTPLSHHGQVQQASPPTRRPS
jgi:hypothetical protein